MQIIRKISVIVAFASLVPAQSPSLPDRPSRVIEQHGFEFWSGNFKGGPMTAVTPTQIDIAGDLTRGPGNSLYDDLLVLSGARTTSSGRIGRIELWDVEDTDPVLLASTESSGADWVGVYFDHEQDRLFRLDGLTGTLSYASWTGFGNLPTSWTTVPSPPMGSLNPPSYYELRPDWTGTADAFIAPIGRLDHTQWAVDISSTPAITVQGTPLFTETGTDPNDLRIGLLSDGVFEGSLGVKVFGLDNHAFELLSVGASSSVVLGNGFVAPGNTETIIGLSRPLKAGEKIALRRPGQTAFLMQSALMRTKVTYGAPDVWNGGESEIRPISYPNRAFIGNQEFFVSTPTKDPRAQTFSSPPSLPTGQDILMAVAFRIAGSPDPVVTEILPDGSTRFVLSTPATVVGRAVQAYGSGNLSADLPIPNDPNLAGSVVFVQFWVPDGQYVRMSDICGFVIDKPAVGTFAGMGAQSAQASSIQQIPLTPSVQQNAEACAAWCADLVNSH